MAFTPIEIENQKFEARMRGYDRGQVRSFLTALAEEAAELIGDKNLLEEEVTELKRRVERASQQERKVQETILALRDLTEKMKDEAKREAELIIREARMKAAQLLEDARSEAVRIEGQISQLRIEKDTFEDRLRMVLDEHQRLLIQRRQEEDVRPLKFRKARAVEA